MSIHTEVACSYHSQNKTPESRPIRVYLLMTLPSGRFSSMIFLRWISKCVMSFSPFPRPSVHPHSFAVALDAVACGYINPKRMRLVATPHISSTIYGPRTVLISVLTISYFPPTVRLEFEFFWRFFAHRPFSTHFFGLRCSVGCTRSSQLAVNFRRKYRMA